MKKLWIILFNITFMSIVGFAAIFTDNPGILNIFKCYVLIMVPLYCLCTLIKFVLPFLEKTENLKIEKSSFWDTTIRAYYLITYAIIVYKGVVIWAGAALISYTIFLIIRFASNSTIKELINKHEEKIEAEQKIEAELKAKGIHSESFYKYSK